MKYQNRKRFLEKHGTRNSEDTCLESCVMSICENMMSVFVFIVLISMIGMVMKLEEGDPSDSFDETIEFSM